MDKDLALLHEKVDVLMGYMDEQRKRQQAMDELKDDLVPIANQMISLSIDELADIGSEFRGEDLLFLLKRVLRDTHLMIKALDQLEAIMGITDEVEILGKQVFNSMVEQLDVLERKGYFAFANQGMEMMERIVTEFDQEDVAALSDNIVTILKTVRNMTQPDIMALANQSVDALRTPPASDGPMSTWQLLKELSDPKVRIGMSRMLNLLKTMGDQPTTNSEN